MAGDYVDIIEAAYALETDEATWLRGLIGAARSSLGERGDVWALVYELGEARPATITRLELGAATHGFIPGVVARLLAEPLGAEPGFGSAACGLASDAARAGAGQLLEYFRDHGVSDVLGLNAADPAGNGVFLGINFSARAAISAAARGTWSRVAAHVAAAHRLRNRLSSRAGAARGGVEAVLQGSGELVDAEAPAATQRARIQLRKAVGSLERARNDLRRSAPASAVAEWKGLVSARWTLVDHFASDGKRYVIARRNDPAGPTLEVLTERERQVVGFAALGHANKLIGYELGIATSTVGVLLSRAMAKLGCTDRKALRSMCERLLPRQG